MKWDTCKTCSIKRQCENKQTVSCRFLRAEAEAEVSRLKALIDSLYNAYSNDRDPMRADTIANLYKQKDSK